MGQLTHLETETKWLLATFELLLELTIPLM